MTMSHLCRSYVYSTSSTPRDECASQPVEPYLQQWRAGVAHIPLLLSYPGSTAGHVTGHGPFCGLSMVSGAMLHMQSRYVLTLG